MIGLPSPKLIGNTGVMKIVFLSFLDEYVGGRKEAKRKSMFYAFSPKVYT